MNVLKPISDPQTLLFIPRYEVPKVNIKLLNELTEGNTLMLDIDTAYSNGYMTISISHTFNEGDNYSYQIEDVEGNLMYRGKIYITSQTDIQNYKISPDLLTI